MRYLVPQFLETEQKIWGPFTFKNFIIAIGVGGALFMLYFYLNFVGWILTALVLSLITLALMFYKRGGRPLLSFLVSGVKHLLGTRRYIWIGVKQKENPVDFFITPLSVQVKDAKTKEELAQEKKAASANKKIEELSKMLDQ